MSAPLDRQKEFSQRTKIKAWERAGGRCDKCGHKIQVSERRVFDHIVPDALKGLNDLDNCQVLCGPCDKAKTKKDVQMIRKADRQKAAYIGAKPRSSFPANRNGKFRKRMNGKVELR